MALNEVAEKNAELIVNNSFIDSLSSQIKEKEKYGLTFPDDYNPTNALMGAYLTLKDTKDKKGNPVLESCSQASIANALMDMVTMGLNMQKKQCYPVPYGGKLQLMVSYHGNKTMAHRCGAKTINSEVIYEGDTFKYHVENGRKIVDEHVQDFQNIDLNKIVGAYCVINMDDGSTYVEVMNIDQIEKAWQKGYGYKPGKGVHGDFADMMAKKTVTSRACKQIVQQYGDSCTAASFEESESHKNDDVIAIDVEHEIEENENSVDFKESEIIDSDAVEVKEISNEENSDIKETVDQPEWMK